MIRILYSGKISCNFSKSSLEPPLSSKSFFHEINNYIARWQQRSDLVCCVWSVGRLPTTIKFCVSTYDTELLRFLVRTRYAKILKLVCSTHSDKYSDLTFITLGYREFNPRSLCVRLAERVEFGQLFLRRLRFFPVSINSLTLHAHLYLQAAFTRRTRGQKQGTF